ncbi:MAG: CHAT domain-containing protein [Anaerolineales bacterium]|nr:CHAT domain-containing protein [Anaerolineales bacterium]
MPTPPRGAAFIIRPDADLIERYPVLRHNANDLARAYARKQFVTDETLQAIGRQLWQALAIDDAFAAARQAAGALTLPVIIASRAAALQQLPETLHHPQHGFLGRANGFTLLRNTDGARPALPAVEHGPLRVLLFTSLPDDLDAESARLDVEEEQAQVLEALNPFVAEGGVVLETPDDGRFSTLQTLLKEFRPHLLFLSGHGKFHHAPHSGAAPYATFLFEGEEGGGDAVHEAAIAEALLGTGVGCVVLSACESGMTASDALSNGLTWRLSQLGIPHVVGMRESVLDRAGTLFIRAFCEAIVRQTPVDEALQAGRRAIITPLKDSPRLGDDASGLAESSLGQWPLPSLISHDPAQPLIDWNFTPHARELLLNQTLNTITLPPRFIGRRAELRTLQSRLRQARLHQLLITGPGGQGKTALAGRLAQLFEQRGLTVFAWSARPENDWQLLRLELELSLSTENIERYNRMLDRLPDEEARRCAAAPAATTARRQARALFRQPGKLPGAGHPAGAGCPACRVDQGSARADAPGVDPVADLALEVAGLAGGGSSGAGPRQLRRLSADGQPAAAALLPAPPRLAAPGLRHAARQWPRPDLLCRGRAGHDAAAGSAIPAEAGTGGNRDPDQHGAGADCGAVACAGGHAVTAAARLPDAHPPRRHRRAGVGAARPSRALAAAADGLAGRAVVCPRFALRGVPTLAVGGGLAQPARGRRARAGAACVRR